MNEKFHSNKSVQKPFQFEEAEDLGNNKRHERPERRENKPFHKVRSENTNHEHSDRPRYSDRPNRRERLSRGERTDHENRFDREEKSNREERNSRRENTSQRERLTRGEKNYREEKAYRSERPTRNEHFHNDYRSTSEDEPIRRGRKSFAKKPKGPVPTPNSRIGVRLNKYISNAGICSRREADKLIEAGSVSVNGQVITQMGYMVQPGDVVNYGGETLRSEAKRYFLLNKPKGFITTVDDPQSRETVMMLIDGACPERIYPVGRLDRNTTGLLLFTNDGEMAKKLTHPSTGVYKIYHVELNKPVTREDMKQMLGGIELEDGPIHVDDVQYVEEAHDKRVVGVVLHSGKNRIVRRIFEYLGYDVHKLDRVVFAGLTKKDLPRGRYRELTEKEVSFLKMI